MKLERLHEHLTAIITIVIAIVFAMWCGKLTGEGAEKLIAGIVVVVMTLAVGMLLRGRIWIVIPLLSGFSGAIPSVPFSPGEMGMLLAFGWLVIFIAVKIIRTKVTYTLVDFVLYANLIYLATVFIRHPVGVDFLGSDLVGGRAYFSTVICFLGYSVLRRSELSEKDAWRLPIYCAIGGVITLGCGAVGYFLPSIGTTLGAAYTGFLPAADPTTAVSSAAVAGAESQTRLAFTANGSQSIILALCSYFPPITLINPLYIGRFLATGVSFFLLLLSGFRSAFMGALANFFLGTALRNRAMDVVKIAALGGAVIALVVVMQGNIIDLPLPVQRALSFLPGDWDRDTKAEAQDSVEWRVMMWKAMMTENKYLENRWLGDGFGFSRLQFQIMQRDPLNHQENFLVSGQVHSGPISAIRFVGFVGLVLYLVLMIAMAIEAAKLMRRALGTRYFPAAAFVGIPLIFAPIGYVFIFGAYQDSLPWAVLNVGWLHLIRRGLAAYKPAEPAFRAPSAGGLVDERPALMTRW